MANEWKVGIAAETELEATLQNLDAEGFEIREIFLVQESIKTRFVAVAHRELAKGKVRRYYQAQPVSIRCPNGKWLRWQGLAQPLHAASRQVGPQETFLMARLEERYGEEVRAFRAAADLWVSMSNESFSGPAALYRPNVGGWQMFSALTRDRGKVALRTFHLADGSYRFLGLDGEGRLEAQAVTLEEAQIFAIEAISGMKPEDIGVTLHF